MQDNEFLAGIRQEGEALVSNPDEKKPEETSSESPAETTSTEETPSSDGAPVEQPDNNPKEKNIPFDKHPRWIERETEWKNKFSALQSEVDAFKATLEQTQETPKSKASIPQPFIELFGENEDAWDKWQELSKLERETIRQELAEEQTKAVQMREAESKRWTDWVEQSVSLLETKHNVSFKKDSLEWNELMKTTLDYLPTDENGNVSLEKGYDLMLKLKAGNEGEKNKARKVLAASTDSETKSESSQAKDFFTPKDLRRGWNLLT